jgi:hypothetical protein
MPKFINLTLKAEAMEHLGRTTFGVALITLLLLMLAPAVFWLFRNVPTSILLFFAACAGVWSKLTAEF